MSYSVDIKYYIQCCTDLEREISDMLEQVPDTNGAERRNLLKEIESKVSRAKEYVSSIQMEVLDITDDELNEQYTEEYETHNAEVTRLEEEVKAAGKSAQQEEKAKASGVTTQQLMDKSKDLQEIQKRSLDNSINTINNIKEVGNDTLVEIDRQKEQLEKARNDMVEMDSELNRAKKIMKVMITRAAGDNCVRVLALLVLLAVIAVIVVEAVSPGAIKKQVDGWFTAESGDAADGEAPTPLPEEGTNQNAAIFEEALKQPGNRKIMRVA
ncbi:vesicle transport through interaction with t-SNAREs 1A-like protein [Tritrichomonas foetus]|uniref:Vesicle transport through interaction with t-SNAREs 1A-like protein n=1 Tax=Tritrichomonas foetus TaxID=1144522 RepID=A0A1J4K5R9_9EUKA|nr:vesicle transport through interaction with t-SNAREs 1A-like protein [Tritrichomonas foetus]|eukprot:OHT06224.1 vesicle transport through interaction with t-SNAREs 1A-like protein [Tritrichomonas foetus]